MKWLYRAACATGGRRGRRRTSSVGSLNSVADSPLFAISREISPQTLRLDTSAVGSQASWRSAGRELFTKKGYDATSTDEIVERSRLSKGALYHHFNSKHELFRAVFEDVEAALIQRSGAEAGDFPPAGSFAFWEESMKLFLAYLDAASDDAAFRQIVLIDGPAVLGWELWREIQTMLAPDYMETWLQNAIDHGLIAPHPVSPLAHLLVAAMNEAVMYVAHSPDPAAGRSEVAPVVRALFEGLRLNPRG